uniref:SH3 domain-containing protein n=1 Tax=Branchiostoma floridae TaxID=7739 RepID=C3ZGE3_BRAFL|eukprot:XP_002592376.1 hypothetical protein BRAFLDRAFT_118414 [Branchiostoma floridae]
MRNGQEDMFTSPGGGDSFPRAPIAPFLSNSLDSNASYEDVDGENNRKCLRSPFVSEEDLDSMMFIEGEPLSMLFTQNLDLNNDILNMKKPIVKDNWQHMSADSLNENYQSPVMTGKTNVAAMLKSHPSPNTANGNMEAVQETSISSDSTVCVEESCFEYAQLNDDVTESDNLCSHNLVAPKEGRIGNARMYSFPKYSDDFTQNIAVEMLQRQGGGLHSSLEVNCSNSINASPWSDSHSSYESNDSYNDTAYGHDSAFLWEGADDYGHVVQSASGEEFQLAIHRLSTSCPKMDRLRCRERHSYPPCQASRHQGYTVIVDGFENGDLQHSVSYPVATMKTPEGYFLQAPLHGHKYRRRWSEKERKERLNSEGIEVDDEEEDDGIIENASGNEVAMEESLKLRRESLESEKAEDASGRLRLFSDPGPKLTNDEVTLRDNHSKSRPLKARPHSLPIRPYNLAFPLSGQMPRVRRVQKCPSLKTFSGMSRPLAQRSLSCSPYRTPAPPVQVMETQGKSLAALKHFQGGGIGSSNSHQYFPLAHQQPPKSAGYQITHHHANGFGNHDDQSLPRSAGYHGNHVTPKWEFHGNLRFERAFVKEKIQPLFHSALDVHKRGGIKVSVVSPGNRGIPVTVSSYQLPAMKGWQKDGDAEEEMTSYVAIETPPDNIPLSPSCSGEFILVDLRRKKALVSAVNSAVDAILDHFGEAREPAAKARLGNSSKTPNIGHLVLRYLCPAMLALVEDGLRPFLRNPIVGRVKNNVWNVVEASTQMGPATKSLNKLANHLGKTGQMWDINMRFNAFICGLLNLKAVELWLTHLQARYDIVQKHYIPEAFLTLSYTAGRQLFDDVVVIVQPLSLLPFALDTQFEFNIKQEEMEREIGKQRLKEEAARTSPRSTFQMMTGKRIPRYQPSGRMEEDRHEEQEEEVMVIDRPEETPVDQDQTPKEKVDSVVAGEDQQPTEQPKNQSWWFQLMNSTPVEAAVDRKTSETTSTISETSSEANATSVRSKLWLSNLIGAGPRPNQEARSKVKVPVTQEVKKEEQQNTPNGKKSRWASFSSSLIQAVDRVLLPTSSRTPPPSPRQHHSNQTPPSSPRQHHSNQTPPSSPRQQHSNQMPFPSPRQQHSNKTTRREQIVAQEHRKDGKRVVKALCHHLATEDGQLSLTKGDILTVVRQVDDDWLLCCHGNKTGLVLTGCVDDLDLL